MSEQRKYRSWTAEQKLAIVLAGLRGDRSVKEVCREHRISETLFYSWREKLLEELLPTESAELTHVPPTGGVRWAVTICADDGRPTGLAAAIRCFAATLGSVLHDGRIVRPEVDESGKDRPATLYSCRPIHMIR